MATRAKAEKVIQAFGGSIDWTVSEITGSDKSVVIDAPDGHVWQFNSCEVICVGWHSGSASEFWDEVIDAVEYGVERED